MAVVSSLFFYPIKSCRGISVEELRFDERGPRFDRRWMLVDTEGRFLSQRSVPKLALIETRMLGQHVLVSCEGYPSFQLPTASDGRRVVSLWDFTGEAWDLGDAAAEWFGAVLGRPCRLVQFADDVHRAMSRRHTDLMSEVAFADGYPALLVSLESLSELNRRLDSPLPMNRFRPNVVVRNCQPFEEDHWSRCEAPGLVLSVVKPCSRCAITTVDQRTAERSKEPLAELARFRRRGGEVMFGQNCVHHGPGVLRVGDELVTTPRER